MLGALTESLQKSGFEIKILTYSDASKKEEKILRVERGRYLKYFFAMLKLSKWADLIYVTDTYSVGYFAYLLKKITGKKYVLRFTGDSAWEIATAKGWTNDYILDFQNKIYDSRIENLKNRRSKILLHANAVIVDSDFNKNLAEKIGVPANKIHLIRNSVDFFKNVPQWKEPDTPALVFSGRFTKWKGLNMLIDLMPKLRERYENIIFEIIGDGPERQSIQIQKSRLNADNVLFEGSLSEEESQKIFSRSTIFVLNTNYEGLSHAVLNALNVGLPVIATRVGGNPEIIQDEFNGLLLPYNDKDAWFKAIIRLLEDKALRDKFSQNGKKTLEKFKWSELVQKTIGVFKSI